MVYILTWFMFLADTHVQIYVQIHKNISPAGFHPHVHRWFVAAEQWRQCGKRVSAEDVTSSEVQGNCFRPHLHQQVSRRAPDVPHEKMGGPVQAEWETHFARWVRYSTRVSLDHCICHQECLSNQLQTCTMSFQSVRCWVPPCTHLDDTTPKESWKET